MHGGASRRGVDHPNWQGKGYSKDLPTRLRDRFAASVEDPDLSSSRQELALIDARLGELFAAGVSTKRQWGEVFGLVDLRRKVANTEARREHQLKTSLSADEAQALIGCLANAIMRESDEVRLRVMAVWQRLLADSGIKVRSQAVAPPPALPAPVAVQEPPGA